MHFVGLLAKVFYVQRWNKTLESPTDLKIFWASFRDFGVMKWAQLLLTGIFGLSTFHADVLPWILQLQPKTVSQCPIIDVKVKSSAVYRWAAACCKTLTLREWSLIKESTSSTPTAKPTTTPFPSLSVYYYTRVLSPGYILLKFQFCERLI